MANPTIKEKMDIKAELYGICLEVNYGLEILETHKNELLEQAKDLTKSIASTKKKLKILEAKYELMNSRKINYKR
jgi:hypothetical protein